MYGLVEMKPGYNPWEKLGVQMQGDFVLMEYGERWSLPSWPPVTLLMEIIATRKATFVERWDREQEASGSKDDFINIEKTRLRCHSRAIG